MVEWPGERRSGLLPRRAERGSEGCARGRIPMEIRSIAVLPLRTAEAVIGTFNVAPAGSMESRRTSRPFSKRGRAPGSGAAKRPCLGELSSACERLKKECDLQKFALKKSRDELSWKSQAHGGNQKLQERLQAETST